MVVACLALLVALGGTSVAASGLARNSVGTLQLRNSAVTTPKIANRAVARAKIANNAVASAQVQNGSLLATDFAAGQIPPGPTGPAGPAGPPGPFPTALPAGQTIRGAFNMGGTAAAADDLANTSISFAFALSAAPTIHFITQGTAPPSQCPGNATFPQAANGNLCIYETEHTNSTGGQVNEVNRSGATIFVESTTSGRFFSFGTWAVTGA